ncbi:MAG: putative methyltransferase [Lentisphaeria bacterium]|jgi:predicted methyltransferase
MRPHSDKILNFAGVKPGMQVADLFSGGGYYSKLLSLLVGDKGRVYMHNNSDNVVYAKNELEQRLKDTSMKNVVDYRKEAEALEFAPNSLDVVIMVNTYHDIYGSLPLLLTISLDFQVLVVR